MANEPWIAQQRICVTADGKVCDANDPEAAKMVAGKGQVVPQATVDRYKLAGSKGTGSKAVKRATRDKAVKEPPADKSDGNGGESEPAETAETKGDAEPD